MSNIEKNKKVLVVATVDSHILNFQTPYLKLLRDKGFEVHVCTGESGEIPYCDKKHVISITRSPYKIGNIKAVKQLRKIIEENNYEFVECHTPMGSVVTRLAARQARKHGTRVLYTAHGFHFYKGAPLLNWIIYYPIEKWLSKYTDTLITINKEDYEFAKNKFKAKKVELINGIGVSEEKFNINISKEEKHKIREELGIKDNDFVMIYVARMDKNKNHIMIINAMEKLISMKQNIHLLIAGTDELNGYNQRIVEEKKIKNVHFLGFRDDIEKLIKSSDIGISTSKREGLGLGLAEEIYSGIPVIALDNRGHREIIQNNVNGYIIQNEAELIEKIIKLTNKKTYNKMIESSKNTVDKFLLSRTLETMNNIYASVTNKNEIIRVLHILHRLDMGGTENFIMNIYRNMDRSKVQFDFLVHGTSVFDSEVKELGGKIYYLSGYVNKLGITKYKKELKRFIKEHHYKIVHSHVDQTSGLIVPVVKKNSDAVTVTHSHSINNSNNFLVKIYKKWLQVKLNKYSDIKLACSYEAGKWLYGKNNFTVINNAIDTKKFAFDESIRRKIREELKIKDNEFVIGHVGRFEKVKNHRFLIHIFQEYQKVNRNSKLMLIGNGSLQNDIKEYVKEQQLENKVLFLGVKTDANLYYNAMDLFVFPSINEGLGIVAIEAQANGLYVVASNKIPTQTKVTNNISFLDIADNEKWISQIEQIHKENINRVIEIRKEYNIDNTVEKIVKIYQEGVKQHET